MAASTQGRQHFVCRDQGFEFRSANGSQELILAIDVTERHRMEEALRESEASLQALVDNAPFGIAQSMVDEDRLISMNPAMRELLGGYSVEEALQLKYFETDLCRSRKNVTDCWRYCAGTARSKAGRRACADVTEARCRCASPDGLAAATESRRSFRPTWKT